jgi:branched-chain amino acid transport system ATP-binding protein
MASADDSAPNEGPDTEPLVSIRGLDAYYGALYVLQEVDLSVTEGAITAIIGPNGAGKTTLLDCITGFKSFEGDLQYRGRSIAGDDPWDFEGAIGYSTEDGNLFEDMTVGENLRLGGYTVEKADHRELLDRVFDLFPRLDERRNQQAKTLSGGEQQMLSIGRSLMTDPELLILDEPSLGLAPTIIKDISESLEEIHEQGVTILMAEQNVSLALDHADRIYLLEHGSIATSGTPSELEDDDRIRESYFGG